MPRSVAGRKGDRWRIVRHQRAALGVEPPDKNLVAPEINVKDEAPGRIGLDHVGVRAIVPADGEAAGWRVRRSRGTDRAGVDLDVRRIAQLPVLQYRKHRH